jgi:hypothetical protein
LELCRECDDATLAAVFRQCAQGLAVKREEDNATILVALLLGERQKRVMEKAPS